MVEDRTKLVLVMVCGGAKRRGCEFTGNNDNKNLQIALLRPWKRC